MSVYSNEYLRNEELLDLALENAMMEWIKESSTMEIASDNRGDTAFRWYDTDEAFYKVEIEVEDEYTFCYSIWKMERDSEEKELVISDDVEY
jgi:hypothetical protein